jgi:hypothetical protein
MTVTAAPRRLTWVGRGTALVTLVVFGVLALLLPGKAGDASVGVADQLAFFGIGVLLAAACVALTRPRARADERGIWVRNVMGERFFPWAVVVAVRLDEGAPWAQLELHDDETVSLLAVQASDGDDAVEAVLQLRALLQTAQGTPG